MDSDIKKTIDLHGVVCPMNFVKTKAALAPLATGDLLEVILDEGEPMLNVLGFYTNGEWQVLVFPRAKHRPSFYFQQGDDQLLISPAAVELGGICTTPREQDFEKVTREHILQLYNEVCIAPDKFASICARLAAKLAGLV